MSTTNEDFQVSGVSNCYVFKSQLQEYAQKAGLTTPVYETTKEGPSHEPSFRSTVIMNDVRYDSLTGFFNRKAAEQSAAEVALTELAKTGEVNQSITQPVHETGLCKNLLQEYAQKMNYAMPLYQSKKDDTPPGRAPLYSCTVDIGGILYIGGTAKTKREAEIKAARTALLAIQTNASQASENQFGHLTVIPSRKRATESIADEASKAPKSKKSRFKGKYSKKKPHRNKKRRINTDNAGDGAKINNGAESLASASDESGLQEIKSEAAFRSEVMQYYENGVSTNRHEKETLAGLQEVKSEAAFPSEAMKNSENGASTNYHEKETLAGLQDVKSEAAFPPDEAMQNSENGVSTHHHEKETLAAIKEVKSEATFPSDEAMQNSENGVSTNHHEKEILAAIQEVISEAAFPSDEVMQNSENGVSTNYHEKETLAAIQEVKSEAAFPSDEVMQNSENGVSTNHHEKETLASIQEVKSEAAFPSDEVVQNSESGVSTNRHEKETLAAIQEIKSEAAFPSDEAMTNSENGVSTNHREKETLAAIQEIKYEAAFPSEEAMTNSENGVSTNHHEKETLAAIQEIKSEAAFPSEAMTNSENGVSTNHHEKETLAGIQEIKSEAAFLSEVMKNSGSDISTNLNEKEMYQSFVLNNQENFESGKLTELQSKEINIGNVVTEVSFAPEGYILEMSVEMNKQNCNGDMVSGE